MRTIRSLFLVGLCSFLGCNRPVPQEAKEQESGNAVLTATNSKASTELETPVKRATTEPSEPLEKGHVAVVAEGLGRSSDEALKDAFRNSVRQVVGTLLDSETLIKNDGI